MLILKKTSTKKIAIYVAIIVVMVGSSLIIWYQNFGSSGQPAPVDNAGQAGATAESENTGNPAPGQSINQSATAGNPNEPANTQRAETSGEIDLTIFGSEKFKALKENVLLKHDKPSVGKEDPFKPN